MRPSVAALTGAPRARLLHFPRYASAGAVVLAASLPVVFLHIDYQPAVSIGRATFKLSDAAVLASATAALAAAWDADARRRLRAAWPVWATSLLFLGWIVAATFYPLLSARSYAWRTHLVTAGEFCAYALLAPAAVLLVRRRADAVLLLTTLVAWSVAATAVGVAQWAGWSGLAAWGQGRRQPSFLGPHDFAALSGLTLGVGIVALLWNVAEPALRRLAWLAVVSGVVGFVLGGATAGVIGLVPATILAVAVASRRGVARRSAVLAALGATAVASLGVLALRANDFDQFFRFLGVRHAQASTSTNIQTYSQRTLLAYIGLRIWLNHPIAGVGFEGSNEPSVYVPELAAAHRRFPHVAASAFPTPTRSYGVQNLYVQTLSDLGVVGAALVAALVAAALAIGLSAALRAPPGAAFAITLGLFGFVLALGLWTALGFVAGIPLDGLTWLALGLVCYRTVEAA